MNRICSHPFSSINVDIEGNYRLCCESLSFNTNIHDMSPSEFFHSSEMNNIREKFLAGDAFEDSEVLKYCSRCKDLEDTTGESKRTRDINNTNMFLTYNFIDNINEFLDKGEITKQYSGIHLEGFGNKCNLKCLHCSNTLSSTWGKFHKKIEENTSSEEYNYFYADQLKDNDYWLKQEFMFKNDDDLNSFIEEVKSNDNLKTIVATGGEPLLNQHFRKFYKEINDHKPDVLISINTNASIPVKLIKDAVEMRLIKNNIRFSFSYDGLYDVYEFIRDTSKWNEYIDCVDTFVDMRLRANAFSSVQCLNIFQFADMKKFMDKKGIDTNYHLVTGPNYLCISILPNEIKQTLIEKYESINTFGFYDRVIEALKYNKDKHIHKKRINDLYRFLDLQSLLKGHDWRLIFSELAEVEEKYR
tara:strand:+ start:2158 stop:3402 length:1245 start_codon:yes stop_codon:yes gene_type:complete